MAFLDGHDDMVVMCVFCPMLTEFVYVFWTILTILTLISLILCIFSFNPYSIKTLGDKICTLLETGTTLDYIVSHSVFKNVIQLVVDI